MTDMANVFEEFEKEQDRQNRPKEQIRRLVNAFSRQSGQPHSLIWRTLYLQLEAKTGYRVSTDVKSMLLAVESAGYIEDLLAVAKSLTPPAAVPQDSDFEYEWPTSTA